MSPTALLLLGHAALQYAHDGGVPVGGCTRGMGYEGSVGGLYRVLPSTHPVPRFNHNLASGPYLRPNEGQIQVNDEVS